MLYQYQDAQSIRETVLPRRSQGHQGIEYALRILAGREHLIEISSLDSFRHFLTKGEP